MTLNEMMDRFRVASRELFNHFFHVSGASSGTSPEPASTSAADGEDAYDLEVRFSRVEEVLFENLVCEPAKLKHVGYGSLQAEIRVKFRGDFGPVMLSGEVNGSWDLPVREMTRDARFLFIKFFDWDILGIRDNSYVLVQVDDWPSHPEAVGKKALIESQDVYFVLAGPPSQQTTD